MFLKNVLYKRGPSKIFYVNTALYPQTRPGFQGRALPENAESKNVKPLRKDLGLVNSPARLQINLCFRRNDVLSYYVFQNRFRFPHVFCIIKRSPFCFSDVAFHSACVFAPHKLATVCFCSSSAVACCPLATSSDAAFVFQLLLSIPHSFWFYFVLLHCAFCSSTAAALGRICGPDVVLERVPVVIGCVHAVPNWDRLGPTFQSWV